MKITAFIPVRGGSKGIPGKNTKELGGKPLLHWVALACLGTDYIDKVVVATDSDKIAETAILINNPKLEIFRRSPENCTDTASTESAMLEYAEKNSDFTHMLLVQATSPLLKSNHLSEAISRYVNSGKDSLMSLVRQFRFIWKEMQDGTVEPINYDPLRRPRRQDFRGMLVENGAFYITSRERLLDTKCRISGSILGYEMPEETYFEIDSEEDWKIIDTMIRKYHQEQ